MALFSRRRSDPGRDAAPVAAPEPVPEPQSEHEIIRPSTLYDVPDWATLPPIQPLLPEMPFVVSQHFDDSLVSWQPPERFLGTLGHSVSPSAPSGIVLGLARPVPAPAPRDEAAGPPASDQPLPLAIPPASPSEETGGRSVSIRRLPFSGSDLRPVAQGSTPSGLEITEEPPELPAAEPLAPLEARPDLMAQQQQGSSAGAAEPAPLSGLLGATPLAAAVQPLVTRLPSDTPSNRFVHAPAPPDMPLAYLPAALLPDEPDRPALLADPPWATEPSRHESTGSPLLPTVDVGSNPPATTVTGLIGERGIVDPPADTTPPLVAAPPSQALPETSSAELSLASPLPSPPTGVTGARGLIPPPAPTIAAAEVPIVEPPAPSSEAAGPNPMAPLLGQTAPEVPGADRPLVSAPSTSPPVDVVSVPLPLARPPEPAAGADALGSDAFGPGLALGDVPTAEASAPEAPPSGSPATESVIPVAPLLGQGSPLAGETAPLVSGAEVPDAEVAGGPEEQPLVGPRARAVPRAGLGEPMADLPTTAASWDLTGMSRAEQVQMSRALIQHQMAASARSAGPLNQPLVRSLPGPAVTRERSGPSYSDTVFAGTALPRVGIENLRPQSEGVMPELPLASRELAPLLSSDPLLAGEPTDAPPFGSDRAPEGSRVRTEIGQRHGVDLANVPVDRSPEGASEAYRLRARAFTSDRGVVIPSQAGSLDSGPGEALFAHELTHMAQRARYGSGLPGESTPAGRVLEADALATEMTLHTGGPARPAPLEPPGEPRRSSWAGVLGDRSNDSQTGPTLPLAGPTSSGPDTDSLAASLLERMSALGAPAPGQGVSQVFTPASFSVNTAPAPGPMGGGVQRADEVALPAPPAGGPTAAVPSTDEQAKDPMSRPSDEDLTNLSRWLYPLIKYRLKGELREDRERAGLLTDHYRRW